MCRICGYVDFANNNSEEQNSAILTAMRDTMHLGGPDDSGNYFERNQDFLLALGHRRLSIIDVTSNGHQPMSSRDQKVVIVFNGEIYNYKEIRTNLEADGLRFQTNSDTEVIINSYIRWGMASLSRFIGMFSFCLYDKESQKIFLVRDRAGVKPLYYSFTDNLLLFASELKAFHAHPKFRKQLNATSILSYFQFTSISAPNTIFKNVVNLLPGFYITVDLKNKELTEHSYWNIFDHFSGSIQKISENEALYQTEELLKSACEYRMVSDVPVGVFLSGGYDSSLVSAILQKDRTSKLKTFSIGFAEADYDESVYAKEVSKFLGTDHTEYICSQRDIKKIIPLLPEIYDEPFADNSAIPTYLVSKVAAEQVKVALSADGGDEVFGGYDKYTDVINFYNKYTKIPDLLKRSTAKIIFRNKIADFFSIKEFGLLTRKLSLIQQISDSHSMSEMMYELVKNIDNVSLKRILLKDYSGDFIEPKPSFHRLKVDENANISSMLAYDYISYLPNTILTKVDRASMANSLESREPLLDHRLIEWACKLPATMKIKGGTRKYLLKTITHKYIPAKLLDRPKKGFSLPVEVWVNGYLKEYFDYYLGKEMVNRYGIINYNYVCNLRSQYKNTEKRKAQTLWSLLMFQMWCERWLS